MAPAILDIVTAQKCTNSQAVCADPFPGDIGDFHGYVSHSFQVDGCNAIVVEPKNPLQNRPWIWRTVFWDAFPAFDIAMLGQGYYLAHIDVGNTFASPDSLKHFDVFFDRLTSTYGLANRVTLEGLSRGGLFALRWGYLNPTKVAVIYTDAPLCDMRTCPGGRGGIRDEPEWQQALAAYHFTEQQLMDFTGNPVDNMAPLAAHHIPIIDVCADSDTIIPKEQQSDIIRERYLKMHGEFVQIVKQGCDHHPHGLADPTMVVNFVLKYTAGGAITAKAGKSVPKSGTVIVVPQGQW